MTTLRRPSAGRVIPLLAAILVFMIAAPGTGWAANGVVPRSLGPSYRSEVALATPEPPGTVLISTSAKTLDLILGNGRALRYRIGVGRDGFGWSGTVRVGDKQEWPFWRPPAEMLARAPDLPDIVPPGPLNPLGARAIYLYRDGRDTLYRIHGTNEPESIGGASSSGCFRMTNTDVMDLYQRIKIGAKIVVE